MRCYSPRSMSTKPEFAESVLVQALDGLTAAYASATELVGEVSLSFNIAGSRVQFRFAGSGLADAFTLAFSHLAIADDGPADLEIKLWDCAATGIARPISDLRHMFAETTHYGDGLVARAPQWMGYQTPRLASILSLSHRVIVGCVTDAADLSFFEIGKPLQPLMFHWHVGRDVLPIHAALVAQGGRGLLLGGKGGSGKSTTALVCAHGGFDFLGDDYVGLAAGEDGSRRGHSFYASAWLEADHSARLPWIASSRLPGKDSGERKTGFLIDALLRKNMCAETEITAIAIPCVSDASAASATPITPAEAMLRLAPSSILQIPFLDTSRAMASLAGLVRDLPCYRLNVGRDLTSILSCVDQILTKPR